MGLMDLSEMNKLGNNLQRMSIAQLKAIMKNLLKLKTTESRGAIKIIKGIIQYKKGRLEVAHGSDPARLGGKDF